MTYTEEGVVFTSGVDRLVGVTALPQTPGTVGVLFLVGGPQYRAGSHRQFTLLARRLAEQGYASLRFDFAGMGDSEGERRGFESTLDDVRSAMVALQVKAPAVSQVVLWGLCDAASAAMLHGHKLPDVKGLVLANPWVHGGEYSPSFRLSHYYGPLLREPAAWKRLLQGKVNVGPALQTAWRAITPGRRSDNGGSEKHYVERMLAGLRAFNHRSLILLSGNDLTAREFRALIEADRRWESVLAADRCSLQPVHESDHTFSKPQWRDQITKHTLEFLKSLA